MGIDEALLSLPGPPTLRLYRWSPPGLSLGYFQPAAPFRGVPGPHILVRRLTGGGAIYHGDEITFALTLDLDRFPIDVPASYELVHGAVARALRSLGAAVHTASGAPATQARPTEPWCFAVPGPHDLVDTTGAKVVGSAQRRVSRPVPRMLHHGSIVLTKPTAPLTSGALATQIDIAPLRAQLGAALATELAASLGLGPEPGELTADERARGADLERRYSNAEFTYGR